VDEAMVDCVRARSNYETARRGAFCKSGCSPMQASGFVLEGKTLVERNSFAQYLYFLSGIVVDFFSFRFRQVFFGGKLAFSFSASANS
jgi:hypothetical protein